MKVGILGGGISAITLQHFLGEKARILESESRPGGLCRTFYKDGFGFDIGGHILFSKYEPINRFVEELLGKNLVRARRANQIFFKGRLVKYPFENDLASLDLADRYECLIGYLKNDFKSAPKNLEDWAYSVFGKGISEKYFLPYNEKIWKTPPCEMSLEWVERIPKPPLEDVVKSALGISTEGYLHQLHFKYPETGGMEAVVKAMIRKENSIVCNFKIQSIRRRAPQWEISDGNQIERFDQIIVTFPIHEAVRCLDSAPESVTHAVNGLKFNSLRVVLIGVNDESLMGKSAVYLPDPTVLCHRICYMGYFSKTMVPAGCSSLIAEITCRKGDGIYEMSDEKLIDRVVNDLDRIALLSKNKVSVTDVVRCEYGYPIYDLAYSSNVKIYKDYFRSLGIDLCGRFADFEYINSDEAMHRAMALAHRLQ